MFRKQTIGLGVLLLVVASMGRAESIYSDQVIATTNPAIYWDLEETGGTVAYDLVTTTGGANDGTYFGSPVLGQAGPLSSEGFGNMGADNTAPALTKNITVRSGVSYDSLITTAGVTTSNYSVQFWFNSAIAFDQGATAAESLHYLLGRNPAGDNFSDALRIIGNGYGTTTDQRNRLCFLSGSNTAGFTRVYGTTEVATDTWNHVVLARSGDTVAVYLNGEEEITLTVAWFSAGGANNGETILVGTHPNNGAAGLTGRIDEVAVWSRALTADEVGDLYSEAVPEPTTWVLAAIAGLGLAVAGWRRK